MDLKKRISASEVFEQLRLLSGESDIESEENVSDNSDEVQLFDDSSSDNLEMSPESDEERSFTAAKDGTKWEKLEKNQTIKGRYGIENIFRERSGIRGLSKKRIKDPLDSWKLLITNNMLEIIIKASNEKASKKNFNLELDMKILLKFIGLVYLRGALGYRKTPLQFIWSHEFGIKFFKKQMPRNKFQNILKFLRFEKQSNRTSTKNDPFVHIRDIFEIFTENFLVHYSPHCNITVDEQLIPSKNRCKFIQYMSNKPDKFGIKLWISIDCKSYYCFNQFPYVGADNKNDRLGERLGDFVVKQNCKKCRKNIKLHCFLINKYIGSS